MWPVSPTASISPCCLAELAYVVERANALNKAGAAWKGMAILVRYNRQGERFAQALGRAGIPNDHLGAKQMQEQLAKDSVKVLSMHASKGLEFPVVFLPCLDSMPDAREEIAAEAKLLYIAMTRAMERLHLTHHAGSVFVDRLRAVMHGTRSLQYFCIAAKLLP